MANEKRMIDADALLMNVVAISNSKGQVTWSAVPTMDILTAPTVDAVEVVRCKDCKYWNELKGKDSGKPVGYGDCRNGCGINGIAYEDSFCSYGKRRDNV